MTLLHDLLFPEGFAYRDELLSSDQERALVERFAQLHFREFEFRGFLGKRRIVSFGWRYDFNTRELQKAEEIPDFLLELRIRAGEFAHLDSNQLQQVLVTEYAPGAGNRLASRPAGVQRRRWRISAFSVLVSPAAQEGHTLGKSIYRTSAAFSIPAARPDPYRLAAQHPARR